MFSVIIPDLKEKIDIRILTKKPKSKKNILKLAETNKAKFQIINNKRNNVNLFNILLNITKYLILWIIENIYK